MYPRSWSIRTTQVQQEFNAPAPAVQVESGLETEAGRRRIAALDPVGAARRVEVETRNRIQLKEEKARAFMQRTKQRTHAAPEREMTAKENRDNAAPAEVAKTKFHSAIDSIESEFDFAWSKISAV